MRNPDDASNTLLSTAAQDVGKLRVFFQSVRRLRTKTNNFDTRVYYDKLFPKLKPIHRENASIAASDASGLSMEKSLHVIKIKVQSAIEARSKPLPAIEKREESAAPTQKQQHAATRSGSIKSSSESIQLTNQSLAQDLSECIYCQRSFTKDRLVVHEPICKKGTKKPPKAITKITAVKEAASDAKPTSDWRSKREDFIANIRYAKEYQKVAKEGGDTSKIEAPPTKAPEGIQCPHCSRYFNELAAERHIPICERTVHRPNPPPKRK